MISSLSGWLYTGAEGATTVRYRRRKSRSGTRRSAQSADSADLGCIDKMSLAGLSETEIADLFRHAADELEKIRENDAAKKPQHRQK
jgi:hypothetical protein